MRIFCPAMVATFPSLKPLLVGGIPSHGEGARTPPPTPAVGRVAAEGQAPPLTGVPGSEAIRIDPWAPHAQLRKRDASRDALPPGAARGGRDTLTESKLFKQSAPTARNATYSVCRNQDGNVKSGLTC